MKKLIALFALVAFFAAQPISAVTVDVEKANIEVTDDEKPANKEGEKEESKDAKSCSKEEKKSCDKPCDKKDK